MDQVGQYVNIFVMVTVDKETSARSYTHNIKKRVIRILDAIVMVLLRYNGAQCFCFLFLY